jgi:hypothetical protein
VLRVLPSLLQAAFQAASQGFLQPDQLSSALCVLAR